MQDTLEYVIGNRARCAGEECGELEVVVLDPVANKLTHVVVQPDAADDPARLVPAHLVWPGPDGVDMNCTLARFEEFEPVADVPAGEVSVRRGEPVRATDGEVGTVRAVMAIPLESEVTHVVLDDGVAIPIREVDGIDDDGVAVRLSKDQIKDLSSEEAPS